LIEASAVHCGRTQIPEQTSCCIKNDATTYRTVWLGKTVQSGLEAGEAYGVVQE